MSRIVFHNSTELADAELVEPCREALAGWAVGRITLFVRYSRGADFSGTCFYADRRVFINLGRHLEYPYMMATNVARAVTVGRRWYRPVYFLEMRHPRHVVHFVFLHELYHLLVARAGRNTRQKESRCDRFAARFLADRFGACVRDKHGALVPRPAWDFQDLEGFVADARHRRTLRRRQPRHVSRQAPVDPAQLLLFGR